MSQVEPATHEAEAQLFYAPVDDGEDALVDYDGLDPYWALSTMLVREYEGYGELHGVEIDGEQWDIRLNYRQSGFKPRAQDDIDAERLYEIDINASGYGERKCHYNVSPRFPSMRHYESGDRITTPFDHTEPDTGLSVSCQPSNMELDEMAALFPRFVFELADNVGMGLYHGYFQAPFDGWVKALERYVRITRTMNEKIIATGGILNRMAMLLSNATGTKGEHKWNNERARGHHHVVRHGSTGARELIQHHRLGGQIKSYLPEHPENFEEGDALYYPKVGAKFVKGRTAGGSVRWADRHDVIRELDERLLSLLSWAGVPTQAGGTTYIPDDHFTAKAAASSVSIHGDPLPQLEANQDHLLMTVLRDMCPSDQSFTETLATDGGMHVDELVTQTGYSRSTLYRALKRLPGLLDSENGHVQFTSEKLRQEVQALINSVEHGIQSAVDRAARVVDLDLRQSASSAFDRWLVKYGAAVDWPDQDGDRPVIRIDAALSQLKSTHKPLVGDVLTEMLRAWRKDGRDPVTLLNAVVKVSIDGTEYACPVRVLR